MINTPPANKKAPADRILRFKRPDAEQPRRLARKAATARYLNRGDMTLWRWMHNETLHFPKPIKIGNAEYLNLDEVDEWLRQRIVER
jgi:predicted DNA-binding transcriptional regulator AlpA